jgi:hypothetical protein
MLLWRGPGQRPGSFSPLPPYPFNPRKREKIKQGDLRRPAFACGFDYGFLARYMVILS